MEKNYPLLFEENVSVFESNGAGYLCDCISCKVTEKLNGSFELEINYPITGYGFDDIRINSVILTKPNPYDDPQPFRVYKVTKPIGGIVTVYAEHKYYELSGCPCRVDQDYKDTPSNCSELMSYLSSEASRNAEAIGVQSYIFETDITRSETWEINTPTDIKSLMAKAVEWFGGEWKINGNIIKLCVHRGEDRAVKVMYGSNLRNIDQEEQDNSYTHIMPFWVKNDEELYLDELYIRMPYVESRMLPRVLILDMSGEFEDMPSEEELRTAAEEYAAEHSPKGIEYSQTVRFISRGQTIEYASLGDIDHVELGDDIEVQADRLGISTKLRCISLVYDVLRGVYESAELGLPKQDLVTQAVSKVEERGAIVWSSVKAPTKNVKNGDYWIKISNTADMTAQQFSRLDGGKWKLLGDFSEYVNTNVFISNAEPKTESHALSPGDVWIEVNGTQYTNDFTALYRWEKSIDGLRYEWRKKIVLPESSNVGKAVGFHSEIFNDYSNNSVSETGSGYNHVEGYYNKLSSCDCTHVGGRGNVINHTENSAVYGQKNTSGIAAVLMDCGVYGNNNTISGRNYYSVFFGSNNETEKSNSSIIGGGYNTIENAAYSFVSGTYNTVDISNSVMSGVYNSAEGSTNSLIAGEYNIVKNMRSGIVAGLCNYGSDFGLVCGRYNAEPRGGVYTADLVIGIGTDSDNRRNGLSAAGGDLKGIGKPGLRRHVLHHKFRHRAAADVAVTYEQDFLHGLILL